jgi:hypothetical protein
MRPVGGACPADETTDRAAARQWSSTRQRDAAWETYERCCLLSHRMQNDVDRLANCASATTNARSPSRAEASERECDVGACCLSITRGAWSSSTITVRLVRPTLRTVTASGAHRTAAPSRENVPPPTQRTLRAPTDDDPIPSCLISRGSRFVSKTRRRASSGFRHYVRGSLLASFWINSPLTAKCRRPNLR